MQALTKWCSLGRTLPSGGQREQPVSGLLFLSKQGSTGQRSLHASSHDACMRRSNGSSVRCPMTLHHWPFRMHWRPQQVQVAPLAPAAKVARRCFSLGAAAGTDGAPRQGIGTCLALSAGITSPQLFVDSRTARKSDRTRPRRCCLLQFLQQFLYRPAVPPSRK